MRVGDCETLREGDCPEIVKIVDFVTISSVGMPLAEDPLPRPRKGSLGENAFGRIFCQIIDWRNSGCEG